MNLSTKQNYGQKNKRGCQGGGGGGRMEWETGVSRCKLLHIERINNKVLLLSTVNYIQYSMISMIEKNV